MAESHKQTEAQLRQTDLLLKRAIRAAVKEARAERQRRQQLESKAEAGHAALEASLAAFIESMRHGGNGHPQA